MTSKDKMTKTPQQIKNEVEKEIKLLDRNEKEFKIGDICKYRKVDCGNPNQLFVIIERKNILLAHRQGFYEDCCAGCWDITELEKESFNKIKEVWGNNGYEYYDSFEEYLDLYCLEIIGNIKEDSEKFDLDPQYKTKLKESSND
jgi:hypothetical protein